MTKRINGFKVVLEKSTREDDAEAIKNAILCLNGVIKIVPIEADNPLVSYQIKTELKSKILNLIMDKLE